MSFLFAILFYVATLILMGGVAYKVYEYARTPAPLKIPTTPAPTTAGGMAFRMFREVVFFESLFKSNLWIWALGWLFHSGIGQLCAARGPAASRQPATRVRRNRARGIGLAHVSERSRR